MLHPHDWITFLCTVGFVIGHFFGLALWVFGLFRTRLSFFYILILAALLGLGLSAINVLVYYDPRFMPGLLGQWGFVVFFYWYTWLLLFQFIVSLIGMIIMVRWICRATQAQSHAEV